VAAARDRILRAVSAGPQKGPRNVLGRANWRLIAYWFVTILVAYENLDGFIWGFLHIEYIRVLLTHLGYPQYFGVIVGTGQLACAVAMLIPRFPVIKEWAYTGAFINYSAALASHLFVGDRPGIWLTPVIMLVLLLASWALRPSDRRTTSVEWVADSRPAAWLVPVALLAVFAVVALFTLPAPPQF